MRTRIALLLLLSFPAMATASAGSMASAEPAAVERLAADTPKTTLQGNTFVAPSGWTVRVAGNVTTLEPPEGDSSRVGRRPLTRM